MNDWINKLANEKTLSAAEQERLDEALAQQEQSDAVSAVRSLSTYEAPEAILEGFDRTMVKRSRLRFASAFGACAAACLAMFFVLNRPDSTSAVPPAEASAESLYEWHNEAVATSVLPGDGANLAAFSQVARGTTENR